MFQCLLHNMLPSNILISWILHKGHVITYVDFIFSSWDSFLTETFASVKYLRRRRKWWWRPLPMLLSSHDVTLLFGVFCWRPCSPQGCKALLNGPLYGGTMWSHSSRLVHAHVCMTIIQREDLHLRRCDAKREKVLSEQLKTSHCWCPTLTR